MYCIIVAKRRVDMILVTLTYFLRSPNFQGHHPLTTVKSAFSEHCLLNQWMDLLQTFIDTLFGDREELINLDFILKVTTALCNIKFDQNCVCACILLK